MMRAEAADADGSGEREEKFIDEVGVPVVKRALTLRGEGEGDDNSCCTSSIMSKAAKNSCMSNKVQLRVSKVSLKVSNMAKRT
jgi:hypothetical protein